MARLLVSLRGGPADGQTVEIATLAEGLEVEVNRWIPFSLTTSVGGSRPLVSAHQSPRRHRYRLVREDPPVLEWAGEVDA